MPGPPPKDPGRRQRRNTRSLDATIPAPAGPGLVPAAESDWLKVIKDQWSALWRHPIVATFDRELHEPTLRRLFDLRDERERYRRAVRKEPLVEGSQGQPVLNPLRATMATIDKELTALEDRFGLNVGALLKLGINYGQAKKSLDDLSRGIYGPDDEDEDAGEEEVDPRIIDIKATSSRKA